MEVFNKALDEAAANSAIDNKQIDTEEMTIIKEALKQAKENKTSFLNSLYNIMEKMKYEEQRNNRR